MNETTTEANEGTGPSPHPLQQTMKPENNDTDAVHADAGETAGAEAPDLEAQCAEWEAKAKDHYDRFLRAMAEQENLRKRHDRERRDLLRYGSEGFFRDLLPVLDSFEKALAAEDADAESLREGIQLVFKQVHDLLAKSGVTAIEAQGAPFDPNEHQAISRLEDEAVTTEMVGEEFARGYRLHDRLLRPAMVSVKVPAAPSTEQDS